MQKTQGEMMQSCCNCLTPSRQIKPGCSMMQAEDSGCHRCAARQCTDQVQLPLLATAARHVSHDTQLWHGH